MHPTNPNSPPKNIDALLNPRNVALVGASDRDGHWLKRVFDNLRRFGFPGGVFAVNPNRAEIWGLPCFKSLAATPQPPDHLAIFTPAETLLDVLRAGAAAGARSATIYAAGFGEGGDAGGRQGAARLGALLAETGLVAVGPNCMGVASGASKFATIPDETFQAFAPGPIAVVSQSGAMCASINRAINALGLKIAYLVSCGNQIGCTVGEIIDYYADRPELRVILCYVESIPDADRFLCAARRARHNGKTVVAVKIGGSADARAAALTHTGAMAGRSDVFDVFAATAGVVCLHSLEDAVAAVEFLARCPLPRGRNVAFMTNSGALRSLILEAAARTGAALAKLSPSTRNALNAALELSDADNPLDTKRTLPVAQYSSCLDILAGAPEVDTVVVAEEFPLAEGIERRVANLGALQADAARAHDAGRRVAIFTPLATGTTDYGRSLRERLPHVPVLAETEKALRVVDTLGRAALHRIHPGAFFATPGTSEIARQWRRRAERLDGPTALNEVDSKELLRAYGISLPPERHVHTADEAEGFAREIGFPVVLKAVSAAIAHKSDARLVLLDVRDGDAVQRGVAALAARCEAAAVRREGVLVAKHVSGGIETVLGIARDPEMGLVVMFGIGGIFIELIDDAGFAPPFLDRDRAAGLVAASRAGRLIDGYRGAAAGDRPALVAALVNLGRLACDLCDITESVDINPFLVCRHGEGAFALDALVVLRPPAAAR
jgi:acetate---CoA ligase (ADP-forming)